MIILNVFSLKKVLQMATKFELASKLPWEMMLYVFTYIKCVIKTAVALVHNNP